MDIPNIEKLKVLISKIKEVRRLKKLAKDDTQKNIYQNLEDQLCREFKNITGYTFNKILYCTYNNDSTIEKNDFFDILINLMSENLEGLKRVKTR